VADAVGIFLRMIFGCFLMMSRGLVVAERNESGETYPIQPMQVPRKKMRLRALGNFLYGGILRSCGGGWLASAAGVLLVPLLRPAVRIQPA